jgi:DNA-directed RNA polymerase subunit M/transcription elongation factor TFIIS
VFSETRWLTEKTEENSNMATEKTTKKWEGEGKPRLSVPPAEQQTEVAGRKRTIIYTCYNCGAECSVPEDQNSFTCWKCGAMSGII